MLRNAHWEVNRNSALNNFIQGNWNLPNYLANDGIGLVANNFLDHRLRHWDLLANSFFDWIWNLHVLLHNLFYRIGYTGFHELFHMVRLIALNDTFVGNIYCPGLHERDVSGNDNASWNHSFHIDWNRPVNHFLHWHNIFTFNCFNRSWSFDGNILNLSKHISGFNMLPDHNRLTVAFGGVSHIDISTGSIAVLLSGAGVYLSSISRLACKTAGIGLT
jgi:hypothetical protein